MSNRRNPDGRRVPLLVRLYALLLWLYPARFHREYGAEMLRVRLLPRENWLLLAVALLTLLYFVTTVPGSSFAPFYFVWNTLIDALSVLAGVAWVALGVSLWRSATQPSPVLVSTRG